MASRQEIVALISHVLSEKNRQLLIQSGLDAVPKERRIEALRGLQDLGWISHGGLADFAESYSLTKEGRRIVADKLIISDFEKGVREHIEALRLADSDANCDRKEGLKKLIDIDCELGNWDSALMHCYDLRRIAEKTKDAPAIAVAHFYQGRVERAQNHWDEALESYLNALEIYMEVGDRKGVCSTNRAMGMIYGTKGDHASAIRCFETSLSLAKAMGDREAEAKAEANLAIVYDLEGRTKESETASKNCLAYFIETGDLANAMRISNNLGVLNMSRERYDVAAEYFEKTISSSRSLRNREALSTALVNAAYCYARTGTSDLCLRYTDEAVSILKEQNNLNMIALAYRNYGYLEFRSGNHNKAFEWFERSVRAAKTSGVKDTLAACCYEFGTALIKSSVDLTLAKRLMKDAAAVYAEIGNIERAKIVNARLAAV
ncbi:MAG: tetratricopeptide repeat protein [Thermoplasmata archaeon]